MIDFLRKRWFLISLVICIGGGTMAATVMDPSEVERVAGMIKARVATAIVLFLMSFSLDTRQLTASFRSPAPVLWASGVNFGLIPLMGWALMPLQMTDDFKIGLMIAACTPCTMAAASVWTRKAGGNDAVSLLVTVLTNGTCFFFTPMWLQLTTNSSLQFDAAFYYDLIERLVYAALLPMLAGQLLRQIPAAGRFATRFKTPIGVAAQACILLLVATAAAKAGVTLSTTGAELSLLAVLVTWVSCVGIHLLAMLIGVRGSAMFGHARGDRIAVAFAGSQKTLPIGLFLATDEKVFGNPELGIPFALLPMILYHASQLFIDTAVADRYARQGVGESEPAATDPGSTAAID